MMVKNKKILLLAAIAVLTVLPIATLASQIDDTVEALYDTAIAIGGSIAVIGWVIAGGLYLTAAGSPERIGLAKKALFAAVIGTLLIVIASSSGALTDFIKGIFGIS